MRFQVNVSGCVFMFSSHARQISSGARSSSTARAGSLLTSAALAVQSLLGLAADTQVTRSDQVSAASGTGPTFQGGRRLQRGGVQLWARCAPGQLAERPGGDPRALTHRLACDARLAAETV